MENQGLFAKLMKLDSRQVKKYGQRFRKVSAFWTVLFSKEVKQEGRFKNFLAEIEPPRHEETIPFSMNFLENQTNTLEEENKELKALINAVNADISQNDAQIAQLALAITHLRNMLSMIENESNELRE